MLPLGTSCSAADRDQRPTAIGTLLTATSNLLFALIDPAAPYWAFGFPAAIITVFGADFFFSTGTLFIARACKPHEQSVGGALFQTLTQLGTAFGLAISTVVFNATLKSKSRELGVGTNVGGTNAPKAAQLAAYKGAMWSGFAFGVFGRSIRSLLRVQRSAVDPVRSLMPPDDRFAACHCIPSWRRYSRTP